MPTITPSYEYTNNTTLDPDEHNKNIYTTSNNEGIMSTANGELDSANLDSTFTVQPEHIHPGQAFQSRQDSMRETVDCFQQAFARAPSDIYNLGDAPASLWVPVPGCSLRFYQPYAASFGLLSWSFFVSGYIPVTGDTSTGSWVTDTATVVGVALMLDGTILGHTKRNLPRIDGIRTQASINETLDSTSEARGAQWFDQCHLVESVSKGYHDVQLVMFMDIINDVAADVRFYRNNDAVDASSRIFQRVSFGIRNAKVVTFL